MSDEQQIAERVAQQADRLRHSCKQTAKGEWYFECTMEAPFLGELGHMAKAALQQRLQLANGNKAAVDAEGLTVSVMRQISTYRAEALADGVVALREAFGAKGLRVVQ